MNQLQIIPSNPETSDASILFGDLAEASKFAKKLCKYLLTTIDGQYIFSQTVDLKSPLDETRVWVKTYACLHHQEEQCEDVARFLVAALQVILTCLPNLDSEDEFDLLCRKITHLGNQLYGTLGLLELDLYRLDPQQLAFVLGKSLKTLPPRTQRSVTLQTIEEANRGKAPVPFPAKVPAIHRNNTVDEPEGGTGLFKIVIPHFEKDSHWQCRFKNRLHKCIILDKGWLEKFLRGQIPVCAGYTLKAIYHHDVDNPETIYLTEIIKICEHKVLIQESFEFGEVAYG